MFPDLSYIFDYWFGIGPDNALSVVKTFGLLLAISILVSAYFLNLELKRKAREGILKPVKTKVTTGLPASPGELISNALIGFLLGFKILYAIQNMQEFTQDAAGLILSSKGSLLGGIIGAAFLAGLKYWDKKKKQLPKPKVQEVNIYPHDRIGDITILAAISGVVGAKIFAILEDLPSFFADPLGTFFSGSGMAIYGGLIVAFAVCYVYLKRNNIPPIHVMDAVAPALIIGYGIGRLGCHFSGDGDWGIINELPPPSWWVFPDWLWAYDYPRNVLNEGVLLESCDPEKWQELLSQPMSMEQRCQEACGIRYCHQLSPSVFPTPIYETIMAFIIGGILWALRKRIVIPGLLFFIYLVFNGVERTLIEEIRVNERYELLGLQPSQAQIIGVSLVLIGIAGILILIQRHRKQKAS
jgi:phosphatidylglycerol:prolipoprotein diacylglycerol transferase